MPFRDLSFAVNGNVYQIYHLGKNCNFEQHEKVVKVLFRKKNKEIYRWPHI